MPSCRRTFQYQAMRSFQQKSRKLALLDNCCILTAPAKLPLSQSSHVVHAVLRNRRPKSSVVSLYHIYPPRERRYQRDIVRSVLRENLGLNQTSIDSLLASYTISTLSASMFKHRKPNSCRMNGTRNKCHIISWRQDRLTGDLLY